MTNSSVSSPVVDTFLQSARAEMTGQFHVHRAADATALGDISVRYAPDLGFQAQRHPLPYLPSPSSRLKLFPTVEGALAWIEAHPDLPFLGDPELGLDCLAYPNATRPTHGVFGRLLWTSAPVIAPHTVAPAGYSLLGLLRVPQMLSVPASLTEALRKSDIPPVPVAALITSMFTCKGMCFLVQRKGQNCYISSHARGQIRVDRVAQGHTAGSACARMLANFLQCEHPQKPTAEGASPFASVPGFPPPGSSSHAIAAWHLSFQQVAERTHAFVQEQPELHATAARLHAQRVGALTSQRSE